MPTSTFEPTIVGITGSEGLIGTALSAALARAGHTIRRFDLRIAAEQDVRDAAQVRALVDGCHGVVHLAAVSRVVWGERDPALCEQTNVGGTRNVVEAAAAAASRPFVVFASSREVYGEPAELPVSEDTPCLPLNVYGHGKLAGEALVRAAAVPTCVVRLSNVYGSVADHPDRVVPAFARAAARGDELRIDGDAHTFDFTHLDDTIRGIVAVIARLATTRTSLPPIQLVTGRATTLRELAELAIRAGGGRSTLRSAPSRTYDVARFVGNPARAAALLGWRADRTIADGMAALVAELAELAEPRTTRER